MPTLTESYDQALTDLLRAVGYGRAGRGTYLQSDHGVVWRGLWVTFDVKRKNLIVQPNLGVFCPSASKLRQLYGNAARQRTPKFGWPLVTNPLYDCVRRQCGEDRMPYSYDIQTAHDIDAAAELISGDFSRIAKEFFGHISSMDDLRVHIVARPSGTAAGIYAMILSYLVDKTITGKQIDEFCRLSPNSMTKEFAERFKSKVTAT